MLILRRLVPVIAVLALGLAVASCSEKSGNSLADQPLFGDGLDDVTEVVARVGDLEITRKDMQVAYDELVPRVQRRYEGTEGKQLLLKKMVDDALLAEGALEQGLLSHPDVGRTLITTRRMALVEAMRNIGIPEGHEPTEEDIQKFFQDNRREFMQQPAVLARHIETLSLEEAQEAYNLLKDDHRPFNFMQVANKFSVNKATLENNGEVGWYNPTGVVPNISGGKEFIAKTFNLGIGVHPPIQVGDRWHVVEILKEKPGRTMTYNEARDQAYNMMLPAWNDNMVKDYLLAARKTTEVQLLAEFTPGGGVDPEILMQRAAVVKDPDVRVDYYRLIYTDFPESEWADDALFMSAMVCIDNYYDRNMALRYLDRLLNEYPESELVDDASYLKNNLYNPQGMAPQSIDELRSQ